MHLDGAGLSSDFTIIPFGHDSTQVKQPVHFFLSIVYTPLAFLEMAPSGHFLAHTPH